MICCDCANSIEVPYDGYMVGVSSRENAGCCMIPVFIGVSVEIFSCNHNGRGGSRGGDETVIPTVAPLFPGIDAAGDSVDGDEAASASELPNMDDDELGAVAVAGGIFGA